jgi:hypothetical protein
MKRWRNVMAVPLATLCGVSAVASSTTNEWRFAVSLDGKPIGSHQFLLREQGSRRELTSQARFNVKILFVNAYRYAHDAREIWADDCLAQIDSYTNDNGTLRTVRGTRTASRFTVTTDRETTELNECVMTFAYWNPRILSATHLLNPQTGEYVPVAAARIGTQTVLARGEPHQATRYRLTGSAASGEELQIDLWYSPDGRWLALESLTKDGRKLRYELQ